MDSVVIKPSFSCHHFNLSNPKPTHTLSANSFCFFQFTCFSKFKRSSISVSNRSDSNPQNPDTKSKPISSFSNLSPVLRRIKALTKKWVSVSALRVSSESDTDPGGYLQNGGFGMALLSVTATARVRISPFMATLAANPTFVSGLFAWAVAQSIKVILNFFVEKKWDLRILFACGGMPSSHAALCTAMTTSVAICHGMADSLFPVCLGFSLIVMYDAIGVRRHAGMQAKVINIILEDLFQGHPVSQRKLKELLGHTLSQVLGGALLGIVVACICCQGCVAAF